MEPPLFRHARTCPIVPGIHMAVPQTRREALKEELQKKLAARSARRRDPLQTVGPAAAPNILWCCRVLSARIDDRHGAAQIGKPGTQIMRKMLLITAIAALAPQAATAHVVRHGSIPEAYWGTWAPG